MVDQHTIKPAFKNSKNCIILSTDNGFVPATAVAIQSLVETSSKENYYDIIILHSRVTPFMQETVLSMDFPENFSVRFVNVSEIVSGMSLYTANRKSITMETYYRLFAPWLLDETYEKAFYFDGDMVATKDIYTVFDYDIGNNLIAAVKDYWGICNCFIPGDPRREYQESIGIKDVEGCVIAATVLFNLPEFRKKFTLQQIVDMCMQNNWKQHDQDVINLLCEGSVYYLSADWGYVSDYGNNHYLPSYLLEELQAVTDPILIHYAGARKPWLKPYTEGYMKFWKYAEKTAFFQHLVDKIVSPEFRANLLTEMAEGNIKYRYTGDEVIASYNGIDLVKQYNYAGPVTYHDIRISDGMLHLVGSVYYYAYPADDEVKVFVKVNDELIPVTRQFNDDLVRSDDGRMTCRGELFEFDFPLDKTVSHYNVSIVCNIGGFTMEKKDLRCNQFAPINKKYKTSYYANDGWAVSFGYGWQGLANYLVVKPADAKAVKEYEKRFREELKEIGQEAERNALLVRPLIHLIKKFYKKPVWIVSDRMMKADDNGEVFFRFLCENKKNIKAYFVLSKKSPDYKRLKKIGSVVEPYSIKHRICHLIADYTISSQTDMVFRNPMKKSRRVYMDMLSKVRFIFLQHGVIHNDISGWLCKRRQMCAGFVTTTEKERDSIVNGRYNYTPEEVWLTGMPRFDNLVDKREKIVTILPTWRRFLTKRQNPHTGIWELVDGFSDTKYAKFYRELMNSKKLRDAAEKYGYKIQFKIHPSFLSHEDQFGFDSDVQIVDSNMPYREIYAKSSLIVTDYSSAIYDFVYLRKPMIYCQFDREDFFNNHMTDNVELNYEEQGYGEVALDLESTIDKIIEYMENDCVLKDVYRERIDRFFAFNDRNNCQRIYEKITNIK
ncbi:MAG: CDP-glycerol glycerophosphotransferase family protein [Acutalibacteraceae bacterium]|nr:CDP-glycerol glycerophosphotransferase family protein [Acutalibacteraceae bacterium]